MERWFLLKLIVVKIILLTINSWEIIIWYLKT